MRLLPTDENASKPRLSACGGVGTFLHQAARNRRSVGAIAPSGYTLACHLTDPIGEHRGRALNVLEVGAGSGAVTRVLLPRLTEHSRVDIVETNPQLAATLHELVGPDGRAESPTDRVAVHCKPIEEFHSDVRYDVVISTLPLANFTPGEVTAIMNRYDELLAHDGTLTYFAYRGTRMVRRLVGSRAEARRHHAVEQLMAEIKGRYHVTRTPVWRNMPPATAWRLQRQTLASAQVGTLGHSGPASS